MAITRQSLRFKCSVKDCPWPKDKEIHLPWCLGIPDVPHLRLHPTHQHYPKKGMGGNNPKSKIVAILCNYCHDRIDNGDWGNRALGEEGYIAWDLHGKTLIERDIPRYLGGRSATPSAPSPSAKEESDGQRLQANADSDGDNSSNDRPALGRVRPQSPNLTHEQRVEIAQDWMGSFSETGWQPPQQSLSDEQIMAVIAEFRREVKRRQWRHGDFANWLVKTRGEEAYQFLDGFGYDPAKFTQIMRVCEVFTGLRQRRPTLSFGHHEVVYALDVESAESWLDEAEEKRWDRKKLRTAVADDAPPLVNPAISTYRTVVIDPPWPMAKIEREVRPKQGQTLDYAVKSVEEIADWEAQNFMAEDGCHVYLWTTQRFLEDALRIMDGWGVKRECVLVWNKNVGITPYSWMYNAEFVLFGRVGDLPLLKNGEKVVFGGRVREHSRKPDEFYDLVRLVSPEPRIDVFSREVRDGFEQWGDEKGRFSELP